MKNRIMLCVIVSLFLCNSYTFSQETDKVGEDHPLISRYTGSIIKYYDVKEYDEYILPIGKVQNGKLLKSKKIEGKVTRITYEAPQNRSTLEIYRNYEVSLKKAGFEIIFSGSGTGLAIDKEWPYTIYPKEDRYYMLQGNTEHQRYLNAKLLRPAGDVYVAIYVSLGWYPYALVQLDVIEIKPMETELIKINVNALKDSIKNTGHIAIYGIYFDSGKSDVKSESETTLKEIASFLEQNPQTNLYVDISILILFLQ